MKEFFLGDSSVFTTQKNQRCDHFYGGEKSQHNITKLPIYFKPSCTTATDLETGNNDEAYVCIACAMTLPQTGLWFIRDN